MLMMMMMMMMMMMSSMFPFQVVDVELERPMAGKPSLFGRVMFTQTCIPKIVLDYNERVSYNVFGRPLICRRFISRSRRIAARNGFIGAQW
ncbi:unnamed protein product [Thlaspi arvense]|uniref:Secreted protein n=1 Tax=Thlaspi arvense TaxID=13288 RepID=A0AAU9S886_THLAR|nr:unnamed protein product [Thlaspi arvense]